MFWSKPKQPDKPDFSHVKVSDGGVVSVDVAKLIKHPNFTRHLDAARARKEANLKAMPAQQQKSE